MKVFVCIATEDDGADIVGTEIFGVFAAKELAEAKRKQVRGGTKADDARREQIGDDLDKIPFEDDETGEMYEAVLAKHHITYPEWIALLNQPNCFVRIEEHEVIQ